MRLAIALANNYGVHSRYLLFMAGLIMMLLAAVHSFDSVLNISLTLNILRIELGLELGCKGVSVANAIARLSRALQD